MENKRTGDWGEAETAAYLRRRGYSVKASQFRCRWGEIDLIAEKDGTLCMVEVKTRTDATRALPREAVNAAKQERIRSAAAFYLSTHESDAPVRFDVAEVYRGGTEPRIVYIEDAFR
jgi:putative endonuclease